MRDDGAVAGIEHSNHAQLVVRTVRPGEAQHVLGRQLPLPGGDTAALGNSRQAQRPSLSAAEHGVLIRRHPPQRQVDVPSRDT